MEFISAKGRKLYAGDKEILLRGFGLGGWLLPEGYMWKFYTKCDRPRRIENLITNLCGEDYAKGFWEQYYESYITEKDIQLIKNEGYNSVRLPINARHYKTAIRYIDKTIDWCRKAEIYLVIDMHAAPGGQTGQNIDDSENDKPELFTNPKNEEKLIDMWVDIATRYKDEPVVAGYDLINEPLPNWNSQYNHKLVPLYNNLIKAIRQVDNKHLIIVEGAHWATDFSVFDGWQPPNNDTNIMLQFHKYWSPPDKESLAPFLQARKDLNLPLYMGEGGENNVLWYTSLFSLYEALDISWNFWSYKKMDNTNSPISFPMPKDWDKLITYLDGGPTPTQEEAIGTFNGFLQAVADYQVNQPVFNSLARKAPVTIPAESYSDYHTTSKRRSGAILHMEDEVDIHFADMRNTEPNYKRYGGEEQPEKEKVFVHLNTNEWLEYTFNSPKPQSIFFTLEVSSEASFLLNCSSYTEKLKAKKGIVAGKPLNLPKGRHTVRVIAQQNDCILHQITIKEYSDEANY